MLYRIFTQNQNYDDVKKLVCEHFDDATIIKAEGVWKGESEHSLIIEIDSTHKNSYGKIEHLCYAIKKLNQQDKILVQIIELANSKLV